MFGLVEFVFAGFALAGALFLLVVFLAIDALLLIIKGVCKLIKFVVTKIYAAYRKRKAKRLEQEEAYRREQALLDELERQSEYVVYDID